MTRKLSMFGFVLALLIAITAPRTTRGDPPATDGGKSDSHGTAVKFTPSTIKWVEGPPSLPAGAKMAILHGDLTKSEPYTLRILVPDGYQVPPHWHPADENVTVLQGTVLTGMGEKFDRQGAAELPAGSYFMVPKGEKHYVWTKGETIVQIHGVGPWGITYVNPGDDPRKKRK